MDLSILSEIMTCVLKLFVCIDHALRWHFGREVADEADTVRDIVVTTRVPALLSPTAAFIDPSVATNKEAVAHITPLFYEN